MDTKSVVMDTTKGLTKQEKKDLAGALREALLVLPIRSGAFDAGLRARFAAAADLIES